MLVRECMKRNPVVVRPEVKVGDVLRVMIKHRVTGVSVVDRDGYILGFIPERNIIVRELLGKGHLRPSNVDYDFANFVEQQRHLYGKTAEDVMNREFVTVAEHADVLDALVLMLDNNVSRLPVVRRGGQVVGDLSRTDVLAYLLDLEYQRQGLVEQPDTDRELEERVRNAIHHQMRVSPVQLQVDASLGVVYLRGIVSTAEDGQALEALARRIPGVRDVVNSMLLEHLVM